MLPQEVTQLISRMDETIIRKVEGAIKKLLAVLTMSLLGTLLRMCCGFLQWKWCVYL